ncbi:MAG: hypothetical protein ACYC4L_05600 [Chloroflexota bacterium]
MKVRASSVKASFTIALGISVLILFVACAHTAGGDGNNAKREVTRETVVVSQQVDPYYGLAQRIAQEEGLEIFQAIADALQSNPRYVILVAAPGNLTGERLSAIGHLFESEDYYPGLGIISGSTLEKAEQLWSRRHLAKAGKNYLGGDVDILQLVYEPTIIDIGDDAEKRIALNKENLIEALRQSDYFYWSRHTGPRDWSWNEESGTWTEHDQLLAKDIPELRPAVIYSLTCNPFRPWVEGSMALGFADQGAAAYLGFVNSPHTVAFIKRGSAVPGITSWREFPLGLVAQIHNKVTTETVFGSPQLFMLGDPRIYLSQDQPYRISSDTVVESGRRVITGESAVDGVLAVKIDAGAAYDYLSVKGLTAISAADVFYNNKLQALDLGADKYVLFLHDGGAFEIELLRDIPWQWSVADPLTDAFDFSWVALWLSTYADSNPQIHLLSLPLFVGILSVKVVRHRKRVKSYGKAFLAAGILALVHVVYYLLRLDEYTVSANLVSYTTLEVTVGCVGVFASAAVGLLLMKDGSSTRVKSLGLFVAVSRQLWLTGFNLAFITLLNSVPQITKNTEPWLLSYDAFWLSLIVLVFEVGAILAAYRLIASDTNLASQSQNRLASRRVDRGLTSSAG